MTRALVCLAALALAHPVRAAEPEPCVEVDTDGDGAIDRVVCPLPAFDAILDDGAEQRHAAEVARADADAAAETVAAKDETIAALKVELAKPQPVRWTPLAATAGVAFVVGVIVGVLVAK